MLRGYFAHVNFGSLRRMMPSEIGGLISFIEVKAAPYLFFQSVRRFDPDLTMAVAKNP
jgi:hypothetical protein